MAKFVMSIEMSMILDEADMAGRLPMNDLKKRKNMAKADKSYETSGTVDVPMKIFTSWKFDVKNELSSLAR